MTSLSPDQILETTLQAVGGRECYRATLDALPVPVYVTDRHGAVTYWNSACVAFAGRTPELGKDRWCVTWELYTMAGDPLPHDQCPMAQAIRERRAIREEVAIAVRPNGTRVAFRPYPTPLFDADGELTGAVNMLIDVSGQQAKVLADQAAHCRRLASATHDRRACGILDDMATGFEQTAEALAVRGAQDA